MRSVRSFSTLAVMKRSTQAGCSSIVSGGVPAAIWVCILTSKPSDGTSSKVALMVGFFSLNALKTFSKTVWSSGDDDQYATRRFTADPLAAGLAAGAVVAAAAAGADVAAAA